MAMLEVKDLVSGYGEVQILWETSLKLEKGKLTTLVGSNGVGKSTLLRTVMGLLRPWRGTITFQGQDLTRRSAHARAKAGLVLVPEGRQLFTDMTVLENLEMGAFPPPRPGSFSGKPGSGLRLVPSPGGTSPPKGRQLERRRAANGSRLPGPDVPTRRPHY